MNARQGAITPFSLMTVGLLMVLLATLLVFQSQQVSTTTPADNGMTSIFEPKSGDLIMDQAPYLGGILGFVIALLNRIFNRIFGGSSPIGGGPLAGATGGAGGGPHVTQPNQAQSTNNSGSSGPVGTSGTDGQTQTVQSEPEPEPEPQSLAQRIKCNVFGALGRSC